jgi:hypothetical protein
MESISSSRATEPVSPVHVLTSNSPATRLLVALAGVAFVAHMLVAGNYGYFRDGLYYIADGQYLQAGYVDQPLLMGWLAALVRVTVGDSLVAIHVIPVDTLDVLLMATSMWKGV